MIHGAGATRAPHVTNVSIPGTDAETLLMALDLRGIQASGGSACQSGSVGMSHVLQAMGVAPELASGAMRLSLGSPERRGRRRSRRGRARDRSHAKARGLAAV